MVSMMLSDQKGHVFFGEVVSLFKDGRTVVGNGLHDSRVGGRKVRHGDKVVLVRCKAPVIVVERVADDLCGHRGVKLDLFDAAQHLADLFLGDGVLLVHVKVG